MLAIIQKTKHQKQWLGHQRCNGSPDQKQVDVQPPLWVPPLLDGEVHLAVPAVAVHHRQVAGAPHDLLHSALRVVLPHQPVVGGVVRVRRAAPDAGSDPPPPSCKDEAFLQIQTWAGQRGCCTPTRRASTCKQPFLGANTGFRKKRKDGSVPHK